MDVDARLLGRVWDLLKTRDTRPRPQVEGRRGVSIVDYDDAPADLMIYDEIGFWGVTAQDIAEQMQGRRGDLHVRINSPGGDVFDGYAIFNMLAAHDGQITVTVEGLAASAASFIAMAGDRVRVCLASQMMIHDASGICMGNAADMREWADVLDSVSNTVAGIYADRGSAENGNGNADDWRDLMRAETWYTPQEAVDAGLADEIVTPKRRGNDSGQGDQAAAARWDLTVFQYAGRLAAPAPVIHARHAPDSDTAAAAVGDKTDDAADAPVVGDPHDRTTQPEPADAGTGWAALIGGLLTAPARVSAPSTVDELLGNLHKEGWTAR